ncbi:MAG: TlpA family protein disulfide reductase [Bacteroidaceae bacterium]|nr:TlpA family protein disulfide reductase [Bacteroidaceae bacterium]
MNLIRQKSDELMEYVRAQELTPERRAVADSMAEAYRAIYDNIIIYLRQEVESHRESSDVARLLNRYQRLLGLDYLEEYLSTYPHADQPELADIRSQIAINQHIKPGAQLIDFELPDEVGASHHLSEYIGKGHYVLVDFWASWCGPCRQEMPNVKAAYERFHERGFDILGLSFDNNREAWLRAVADLGMTWPQLSDLKGWKSLAAQKYNVRAIPFTLLFDPEGKVVADNLRGEALSQKLEELLGN